MPNLPVGGAGPIVCAPSVGKPTFDESSNRSAVQSFHYASQQQGSEAMYLGIGGLILLIIILIILFR